VAIQLAAKYASVVDEKFKREALTEIAVNHDYEWEGVATVSIYGVTTQALTDYTRSGTSRFGTPTEIATTKTDYAVSKDRSFSIVIDQGNAQDTAGILKSSGKAMKRQIDEQVIPEVDTYRLAAMATAATSAGGVATAANTAALAYTQFLTGCAYMSNATVPLDSRVAFVTPAFYNFLKLDGNFIKASEMSQTMLKKGVVGEVDGVRIVMTPTSRMPTNASFIIAHPSAVVAVDKLSESRVLDEVAGISGCVLEGRFRYDCFVLANKTAGVYFHKTA